MLQEAKVGGNVDHQNSIASNRQGFARAEASARNANARSRSAYHSTTFQQVESTLGSHSHSATGAPFASSTLSNTQHLTGLLGGRGIVGSSIRTVEPPGVALLRRCLFPISAVVALCFAAAVFGQPVTRPYVVLAMLSFVLSWQLLHASEFQELKPISQAELFFPRVLLGWTKVLGILFFLGFAAKTSDSYSRFVILTWAIATPILYSISHVIAYKSLCHWNKRGRIARTHVIVGTSSAARALANRLDEDASLGTFIGFFSEDADEKRPRDTLGTIDALPEYVQRNCIDTIHIAWPVASEDRLRKLLDALRDTTASIYFFVDVPSHAFCPTRVVDMGGIPLLAYFETPHCGLQGATKRAIDLIGASVLLALIWPLLLVIAIAVRLESRGPIIFKQRRYGLNGEEFPVYKFRTMTVCEDGDRVVQATRNDTRTTRIGKFLRRTSLDELPQLFCVLNGSMSLVGPRPHAIAHNEQYRHLIDGYMLRHKVRPGITGWAQVNGLRGETRTVEQMRSRVVYDLDYLQHWSPWVDFKILLRTALVVLRDRNAY